jgi:hypothetical protein
MKFIILTASKDTLSWKKLPNYLAQVKLALNSGLHADWTVDIEYTPAQPVITGSRIDKPWLAKLFAPYYAKDYDCVGFHFSVKQKNAWLFDKTVNGVNPRTDDQLGDFYLWADEGTRRQGLPQFVQTLLHEFSHEYFEDTKTIDLTHEYHDANKDIAPLFKTFDWSKFQGKRQELKRKLTLLQQLLLKLQLLKKPATFKEGLQPLVKRQAQAIIDDMLMLGHEVRLVEGYRSKARQEALYAQGRTTPGKIVTNAKAGESLHNYGVAVDFVFRKEGYDASKELWQTLGTIGNRNGFEWGGSEKWEKAGFVDKPHFEMTLDYSLKDFQNNKIDWNRYV